MTNEYITEELSLKTKYKSIVNAYQKNNLFVVLQNNQYWYMEYCATDKLYELVNKEMERLFPQYQYIFSASRISQTNKNSITYTP